MDDVIAQLQISGLKRAGAERVGPCPMCGGTDRFGVNVRKAQWQCRRCGGKGDQIALVQFVMGLDFLGALDWMCGPRQELSAAEMAQRAARDAENQRRKEAEAAKFRAKAIADARRVWEAGQPAEASPVRAYLAARGITPDLLPRLPICLRYAPDLPYMVEAKAWSRPEERFIQAHRGPAMLAAIQGPDGRFCAVHRTWFDLDRAQGKARILHPETDEVMARKKILGAKKGGAIRLVRGDSPVLVMGEGMETTFTAAIAGVWPGASFWAGVDLGNMAGARMLGKGQRYAGIPDLSDHDAFVPPPWVNHLIFVQDGDSDPRTTTAKLQAGLRRAMAHRPGLRGQIVACPEGLDLNDVLLRTTE
jgi:hypothetical protein